MESKKPKTLKREWKDIIKRLKELNNLRIENDEIVTTKRKKEN